MTRPALALLALALLGATPAQADPLGAPPAELVAKLKLSPLYTRCVSVHGFPVLGTAKASDYALREAAWLIEKLIGHRPELQQAMVENRVRFVVMAPSEMTTDVPEHSDLTPKAYWNRRARGLGATEARPAVSCGEENLLDLPGDPYATENILVHELSHAIHERGMSKVDPTFDRRLTAAYERAKAAGLWQGTYAQTNRCEYWAEAAQSFFACNRHDDAEHGPIDTREELRRYDPAVTKLLIEVFGDSPWRYQKPSLRPAAERAHLAGFDRGRAGRFVWPASAPPLEQAQGQARALPWLQADALPKASPGGAAAATSLELVNRRAREVTVEWLDFAGERKRYLTLRPGRSAAQSTYAGHVWVVLEGGQVLGGVVATEAPGRVEVR
ncbi:MAG: hypothetical protein AB7N76_06300 [Planctomycetota bacterium]